MFPYALAGEVMATAPTNVVNDINTKDQYRVALAAGLTDREALAACEKMSRDNARTPMQWDASANAGFTTGTPWLKVNDNYREINVAAQEHDPDSVLNYYRRLTALRKSPEYGQLFAYGTFVPAFGDHDRILAYYRENDGQRVLVAANFGREPQTLTLPTPVKKTLLTNSGRTFTGDTLPLAPCEVAVVEL